MRTCSKCGFAGEDELFVNGVNWCKRCKKEYMKEYNKANKEHRKEVNKNRAEKEVKTCSKCGFVGENKFFVKGRNVCKKCYAKKDKKYYEENIEKKKEYSKKYYDNNPEKEKERRRKWRENNPEYYTNRYKENPEKEREMQKKYREENPEKVKERHRKYREENPEKEKERLKKYYRENLEKVKERNRKYREENPEKVKKCNERFRKENPEKVKESSKKHYDNNLEKEKERKKKYYQTPNGKLTILTHAAKRRGLGHDPINKWFKGSEAHHLRYSNSYDERDNDITIYVPRKLHRSIYHNGYTGKGMQEINMACLVWYLDAIPGNERHPKAVLLYLIYCTQPTPEWR